MSNESHDIHKEVASRRYADLLDARADAKELQLIDDLETLYASATLPAQLNSEQSPGSSQAHFMEGLAGDLNTQQHIAPGGSRNRRVVASRGKRWLNRLNALAAVLIAALLVGSLLVINLARQTKAGKEPGQVSATNITDAVGVFSYLHMVDTSTGWAWTGLQGGHHHILRTTDGGDHWNDVTPVQDMGDGSQPFFLNISSAWVAIPQGDHMPWLLYRTTNGGQTWQQSTLPYNETGHIDFVDGQHGWVTVDIVKAGTFSEMDLYRTIDGGQTWIRIAVSTPAKNNAPGALPFSNEDNGVTFINLSTGWITGSSNLNANHQPRLFITHDGGYHWYQQALALPHDLKLSTAETVIGNPQFFSALDGILPVGFWVPRGFDAYITHDGGATWHDTSFVPMLANPYWDAYAPTSPMLFTNINHGWVWVNGTGEPSSFETTRDGGLHWTKIVPDLPSVTISYYNFVSDSIGWAIGVSSTKTSTSIPPVLLKTTNGGKTWKQIRYVVS